MQMFFKYGDRESINVFMSNAQSQEILDVAKESLEYFITANFAGGDSEPSTNETEERVALSIGIYSPVKNAKALQQLLLNKILLLDSELKSEHSELASQLALVAYRTVLAWQKIMPEPLNELKLLLDKFVSKCEEKYISDNDRTLFYLENVQTHLIYYDHDAAEIYIRKALDSCGLANVELSGKMGKRTRFQQKELAQLVVTPNIIEQLSLSPDTDIPTDVALNDDTVLDQISFADGDQSFKSLSSDQLAVILALCRVTRRTEPMDDLLLEKCGAYLSLIIGARRCWAVQCAALLLRADLERHSKRRVERACSQSELIVKLMEGVDDNSSQELRRKRAAYVLASGLDPVWSAKVIHAEILRSLGVVSEALLLYEQLELWDHVIECYKTMGQLEKANSLIHDLLKSRPTDSMLYVYLGEINQNESYYQKAIEVSGDRNAKAHKALGHMLLMKKQYEEAWKHLKRSVELQPIQFGVWFNAGHVSWKLERFENAISCYHRCVCLEPDHFEAWNNLSAAYIRLGEKERAKLTMQEALKFNYEHAKVWENYLLICVDTGDFGQAIQSFHRLLDLKKQQQEDQILEIMSIEILEKEKTNLSEEEKQELIKLKKDLVTLLARIASTQTLSSKVWDCYAELKRPSDDDVTEFSSYVQLLERAFAAELRNSSRDEKEKCMSILESAVKLGTAKMKLASLKGTEEAEKQAKSSIKLTLPARIAATEKQFTGEIPESIIDVLSRAKELLKSVS